MSLRRRASSIPALLCRLAVSRARASPRRACALVLAGAFAALAPRLRARAAPPSESPLLCCASLVWHGQGYALAWRRYEPAHRRSELWFARLTPEAQLVGEALRVTGDNRVVIGGPALVFHGAGFGLLSASTQRGSPGGAVCLARLSADGALLDEGRALTALRAPLAHVDLAWTGRGYGAVWKDGAREREPDSVYFALVSPAGELRRVRTVDDGTLLSGGPQVEYGGGRFAIGWSSRRTVVRFADDEGTLGEALELSAGESFNGHLALRFNGRDFAAAYRFDRGRFEHDQLHFARFSPAGLAAPPTRIEDREGDLNQPSLAWTGTRYGALWTSEEGGTGALRFRLLSADGSPQGPSREVYRGRLHGPRLVWTGREFGAVWSAKDARGSGLYFARLPVDAEGEVATRRLPLE